MLSIRLFAIVTTLLSIPVEGWTTSHRLQKQQQHQQRRQRMMTIMGKRSITSSRLYNIPPPSEENVIEYIEYASKISPPSSFYELQQDCIKSVKLARKDKHELLEIEFPPLPQNVLEMDDISTYDVLNANMKHVLDFSKGLLTAEKGSDNRGNNKIAILLPDEAELEYVKEKFLGGTTTTPYPNIEITSIRKADPNDTRIIKPEQLLLGLFGRGSGGAVKPVVDANIYICLGFSAQELPDIEELYNIENNINNNNESTNSNENNSNGNNNNNNKTFICYNMKLDILRGDLGAPAFPAKEFHDRFLSKIKPVYYLRTRQYSRSTPNPPFLINYQGCLFRSYPGQYQTLLDTGNGRYRRVKGNSIRPGLGAFKQELTDELIKQNILQDEGTTLNFLRTGYKTTTWWEEERDNASNAWKT